MGLGKAFYIKYILVFIPCIILSLPAFFMTPKKRAEYHLKNKLSNIMVDWVFKG
jgi:hypothetical protein